jgi:hypothetical protein
MFFHNHLTNSFLSVKQGVLMDEIANRIPRALCDRFPTAEWIMVESGTIGFGCEAIIDGKRREASLRWDCADLPTYAEMIDDLARQLTVPAGKTTAQSEASATK